MVGQCHRSYQHEFDQTPGGSGRQEGLACSGPWGHEEFDRIKRLNKNKASGDGSLAQPLYKGRVIIRKEKQQAYCLQSCSIALKALSVQFTI